MKSVSLSAYSTNDLAQQIKQLSPDFQATLGLVFCSVQFDLAQIQDIFTEHHIDLVGCTTAGEICDDELLEHSIVALLLDANRDAYCIRAAKMDENADTLTQLGRTVAQKFKSINLLITCSGVGIDASMMIDEVRRGIGREVPMYGGLAGDDLRIQQTFAFTNTDCIDKGVVLLAFDAQQIAVQGLATSGWQPIGVEKKITRSKGAVVYEIDEERAYDAFTRYFGIANKNVANEYLLNLQTNYPLQIIRENDTIMRSPMIMDEAAGTLTLMGSVREGDSFRFSISPGFEVIEQTIAEFEALKMQADEADALILFSCKGRHGAFGPLLEDEISGLREYWQQPMIGFLSYGEIGNTASGICEFHNETCVLVTLKALN